MKLTPILFTLGIIVGTKSHAQYFQFSQYNFAKARVNPAMIATTRYAYASLLYRNQQTAGDFSITSNFFSAAFPLVNASTGKPWSGIGLTMMDDRSGGVFKTQEITLSYALNIRLSKFQTLSFGLKGLHQTKSIGLDGFNTGLQYVEDRGFNNAIPTGESFSQLRASYSTFSLGLHWQQVDKKDNPTAYGGISLFDINQPKDISFGNGSELESTFVFNGGFRAYRKDQLAVYPEWLYTGNYSNRLLNVGLRFQYELQPSSNQPPAKIDVLTKYVPGRSAIVGAQFHRENFSFGVSYDFPAFTSNVGNLGALEVGLEIRKLVNPKANSKSKKKSKGKKKPVAKKKPLPIKKPVEQKKPVAKIIPPIPPVPVEKKEVKKDTLVVAKVEERKQLVITVGDNKIDSTFVDVDAKAGTLRQEPYAFEKILLRFHFEFNSVDLDDETEAFLSDLSKTLDEDKNLKLKIIGHTDNRGSVSYNEKLSLRRAESVRKHLLKKGVDNTRVQTEGKGMSEPIVENDSDENRSKNRRVEILLFKE